MYRSTKFFEHFLLRMTSFSLSFCVVGHFLHAYIMTSPGSTLYCHSFNFLKENSPKQKYKPRIND